MKSQISISLPPEIIDQILFYIKDPKLAVELKRFQLTTKMKEKVTLSWALRTSKLEYLKFLKYRQKLNPLWDAAVCLRKVALDGNYRVLKFYHQNIYSIANESLIDEAAAIGHLNLVKWLDSIGSSATTLSMDWAAEKGHLETLKWLHTNRREGYTYLGLRFAVTNGHLGNVLYILDLGRLKVDFKLVRTAIDNNQLDILNLLTGRQNLSNREMIKLCEIARASGNESALACLSKCIGIDQIYGQ